GLKLDGVYISRKDNAAVKMAALALKASPNNRLRHETLQKFMLHNDAATVAVEAPVWLLPHELEHLKNSPHFHIPLRLEKPLAGHIDFIQIRNGAVYILDYKPGAAKESHAHEQILLYALALGARTGIKLKDMR
ncbi:MAG: PD-(D/E)XK nuclease family protein, partial [Elusimicrobia bacterium]|nr:PD-(D/E)XK nuclease family protein [Elusimicrobiota bacterium]